MAGSQRLIQGNQTLYRNGAIDAALGREAHQEHGGGASPTRVNANANASTLGSTFVGTREAQAETRVSAAPREAHLETVGSAKPRGAVSVSGLHRLGALLQRDENLARKLAKNPRRAIANLDFISERDKEVLAGINSQFWSEVAAVSGDPQRAGGKGGVLEGVTGGVVQLPESSAADPLGGGAPMGWGSIRGPSGPGITLGNGVTVGGRASGHSSGDGTDAPPSGRGVVDYGFDTGNAADPRSPTGRRFGGAPQGGGGNPFLGNANPSGYVYGDPSEGGGVSGGRLPSRAVLAGSAWRALHPGRDVTDDESDRKEAERQQGNAGKLKQIFTNPDPDVEAGGIIGTAVGATIGAGSGVIGGLAGGAEGAVWGGALGGLGGAALGFFVGRGIGAGVSLVRHHWMPADTDLTGGGGGPSGPRANVLRTGQFYIPADDTSGTSPTGPRSTVLRSLRSSEFYFPADDTTGPRGPRSRADRASGSLYMPAPDDPRPGSPHSRALATAGIIPY